MRIQNQQESGALPLFFLLIQPALAELAPTPPMGEGEYDKNSTVWVVAVVALCFFFTCYLSLYARYCVHDGDGVPRGEPRGLNPEVIKTFPTLLYETVKHLMIERATLTCAVCLDEFNDGDTLRLIPKCNHVFHLGCIDKWFQSRSTCPVCRANLVPTPDDMSPFVAIQIPEELQNDTESPNINIVRRCRTMNHNPTPRSRSTGLLFAVLFPQCNSTGRSVGENCERFTLRLPEDVRKQLLVNSTLKRSRSCVNFRRVSSGRRGYRTRSVGNERGMNYFYQYQRFYD